MSEWEGVGCPACDYTGWKRTANGMVRCDCLKTAIEGRRYQAILERSGLRGSLKAKTFSNYRPLNSSQKKALDVARNRGSFFLSGPWGVGKTHLLAASVTEALGRGQQAALISVPWLLEEIRSNAFRKNSAGDGVDLFKLACRIPYLALDDLGKERITDFAAEKMFMLFDTRETYQLRTSVTSNFGLKELFDAELVDGAVISRICGICGKAIVRIEGKDYRRHGGK